MKYILVVLLLCSCSGTRKTDTQHHEDLNIQNSYSEGSKIVLGNSLKYTPFDNAKPMILDGKEYKNAIVSNDKSVVIEKWKYRNIIKTITIDKKKETTRTDNTLLYLGLFLIAGCLVFLWFYLPKFKV